LSSTAGNLRTLDKGSHETEIAPGILADEESELCLELPLSEDDEQRRFPAVELKADSCSRRRELGRELS
jgi:hypothetical protein